MHPKDKSESYLMNNCLSGTMSLGANLLSIFVPSYFLTVTKPTHIYLSAETYIRVGFHDYMCRSELIS